MSGRTRWVPAPPERRESILSGLLGAAVGLGAGIATWYVARTLMAREPVLRTFDRAPLPPERRLEEPRRAVRRRADESSPDGIAGASGSTEGSASA